MNTRIFSCRGDFFSGIVSTTVPAGAIVMLVLGIISPEESRLSLLSASLLMLVLSAVCLVYAPREYQVQPEGISVRRFAGTKLFRQENVLHIRKMNADETKGLIRTFGNGGLFGYTGRYHSPAIGHQRWYCSRRTGLVVIELKAGIPVILSPEDPEGFVEAANEMFRKA